MLISDYSSVQFDFAYMEKPQVYYQFDEAEVFTKHYGRGYFDYRDTGFGEVVTTEEELLKVVEEYLKNNCSLKPFYRNRIAGFFPLHDTHNCERIFDEITR
jgi:CDP-glycerol glycerophosphotransferase (TagB/SpsB family)